MKLVQFECPESVITYPAEGVEAFGKTHKVGDVVFGEYFGEADLAPYTGRWPYISDESIAAQERSWRDQELQFSDWIVPITDHPQHAAYMAYRQALRDWPSTDAFPDTRPELGA
jgi:hypothetical protein